MSTTKADRKAKWMSDYEDALVAVRPELRGKIDWFTATYLYNQGLTAFDAVSRFLSNRTTTGQSVPDSGLEEA